MTQRECILGLLHERPEGITALDALNECNCLRLAARIADLRGDWYHIESEMIRTPSGKHVARYRLVEPTLWRRPLAGSRRGNSPQW